MIFLIKKYIASNSITIRINKKWQEQVRLRKKPTVKSNRKNKAILSKINFKSTRTQLLLVLLSFALIGGGVMAYRSFAAIESYAVKSYKSSDFKCSAGNCSASKDQQKNSVDAMRLAGKGRPDGSATFASMTTKTGYPFAKGTEYKICATARGTGNINIFINPGSNYAVYDHANTPEPIRDLKADGYNVTCQRYKIKPNHGGNYNIQISHSPQRGNASSHAFVSQITVERYTQPTGK